MPIVKIKYRPLLGMQDPHAVCQPKPRRCHHANWIKRSSCTFYDYQEWHARRETGSLNTDSENGDERTKNEPGFLDATLHRGHVLYRIEYHEPKAASSWQERQSLDTALLVSRNARRNLEPYQLMAKEVELSAFGVFSPPS